MPLSGFADLPLHWGHVPPWLARIMFNLSKAILEVMLIEFKTEDILKRFSNPLWFQAFNNVIGMDWDSSGSTTVTTAMVKNALNELNADLRVAGGKGVVSRETPAEIRRYGDELSLNSGVVENLIRISRLGAKVDNALLQDGFDLYHHTLLLDSKGNWVIVQQGMNTELRLARRYHLAWFVSDDLTLEPHAGVASDITTNPLNLTVKDSLNCRKVVLELLNEKPSKIVGELGKVNALLKGIKPLFGEALVKTLPTKLPYYKPVKLSEALLKQLNKAYEVKPVDFNEALLIAGLGPETLRALALISELIYREPPSNKDVVTHSYDPFKYAYAIGGKDGVPYPVKKEVALRVIKELEDLVSNARLGDKERLLAFRALSRLAPKDV
ncbi:MAG: hypothetical protein B7O98_03230 [Zestosphaera tikiterensis]|uniref:DUF763 domain-containing protein n=1 Tax=Zestosphaera tikiterensis TaxID=1973259 RepID=A0A2R7Y7K2_9CREN|nr:MAG: hypothetical protein B7O98_03230 [Zestosphaera tikiterensis]